MKTIRNLDNQWEIHEFDDCHSLVTNGNNVCIEIYKDCIEFEHIVEADNGRGGSYYESKYFCIPIEILKAIIKDHEKHYEKTINTGTISL